MPLTAAVIRGSTVYTPAELFAVYRDELGKPLTQASARAIVRRIAERYRADGYAQPQLTVRSALAELGVLHVDVAEARVARVSIRGDAGPYRGRLERLGTELEEATALRQSDLQLALLRLRGLPGLSVAAAAARDDESQHAYRLDLAAEFAPLSGAVRLTNRGTDEIGPYFVLGQVLVNGIFGRDAAAGVSFGSADDPDEYSALGVVANAGLGRRHRLTLTTFRSSADPRERGGDRDNVYRRERMALRAERTLSGIGRGLTAAVTGTLEWDDLTADVSGTRLRDERLRTLGIGGRLAWASAGATRSSLSLDVVQGLDAFGSGLTALDLVDDARRTDFTLLKAAYVRAVRLSERWTTRLDVFAQESADVLPFAQRFKIGGDRLGRGFEVAQIAGDRGVGAKVELRRRLPRAPAILPGSSVYGFYDLAAAWKHDVPGRESAATAGLGFATGGRRIIGQIELAAPLTRPDVEGRERAALFLEVTARF